LANLVAQRARLAQYAEQALADKQTHVAVACERVIASNLEIVGKLLSKFVLRHEHAHSHLLIHPDYLRLRQALVSTLRRHPAAAADVANVLAAIETRPGKSCEQLLRGRPRQRAIRRDSSGPPP
jgi:hypothetical protein